MVCFFLIFFKADDPDPVIFSSADLDPQTGPDPYVDAWFSKAVVKPVSMDKSNSYDIFFYKSCLNYRYVIKRSYEFDNGHPSKVFFFIILFFSSSL